MESHLAKYRSLALTFHLADGGTGPVACGPLMMAIKWSVFLYAHAKRVYASAVTGAEIAAQTLSKRIRKGDLGSQFGLRDVYRKGWAGLTDKSDTESAIEILMEHGWLREMPTAPGERRFAVNPKVQ